MKDDDQVLPWDCESCGHTLKDSPFTTYECCPECDSEAFYHGSIEVLSNGKAGTGEKMVNVNA